MDNKLEIYRYDVKNILRFLTEQFDKGAAYGSINCYRSALSLVLGSELGIDPRIKRFCKGVSKQRPPKPKYNVTWDPSKVLDHLCQWPSNEQLSLKQLSLKLVTLLALTTGQRMQTLSLIEIENIRTCKEYIEIKIPARIKTSGPGRAQPTLMLPFYEENKKVCVATTLQDYLSRTSEVRAGLKHLLISFKKPFNKITTQSISRWIKEVLGASGIDIDIFTAYSTRHASTSAAKRNGISIDLIKKTAGWTEKSKSFAKFYDLEMAKESTSFANAVINNIKRKTK